MFSRKTAIRVQSLDLKFLCDNVILRDMCRVLYDSTLKVIMASVSQIIMTQRDSAIRARFDSRFISHPDAQQDVSQV